MKEGSKELPSDTWILIDGSELSHSKALLLEAVRKDPNNHEAYNELALILLSEDIQKAERCFKKAIELKDDFTEAIYNLANIYKQKGRFHEAIVLYKRALQNDPLLYQAYYNLANIFLERANYQEAIDLYLKATNLNPEYYEAYCNLGVCYYFLAQIQKAIDYYKRSMSIKPDYADAHFNLGLALLMLGDFKDGWREYNWRWRLPNFKKPQTQKPEWDGSDIKGKTLLVYAEQGYGDTIQFVRYLKDLKSLETNVKFACPKPLISLISNSFPDIDIYPLGDIDSITFDTHCPLLEIPKLFTSDLHTVPNQVPYLRPSKELIERFKALLSSGDKLKVGLAWQGSKDNKRGYYRSIDKAFIDVITQLEGISFISLMVDFIEGERRILDLSKELTDFHHTAGLIANLDLVITIDTVVAHLAGAMGKPVWLMLHHISDWRWMLNRDDSPWYPTMKIFRQRQLDDWRSVIDEITQALSRFTGLTYSIHLKKEIDISHAQVNWDKGLALLKEGDLKNGWRLYEWRRYIRQACGHYPDLGLIEWTGQDLQGKGILVYDEQGFGDTIQFVRFTEQLLYQGARVYILCRKELFRLLKTFNPQIQVFQRGEDFTVPVDYICPLMSLPLHLGIYSKQGLAHRSSYFEINRNDISRWAGLLKKEGSFKIGVSLSSRKQQVYTEKNSVPLQLMTSYIDLEGISLFNIQKGFEIITSQIIDYSKDFSDFYDTASFIMNLDLVISIDTASIHLAGALGKETWLMLPYDSEWRWFDDTDRTIWYPTVRIFKQTVPGDWQGVLERIKKALRQRLDAK